MNRTAVIAGATGLVGGSLLRQLLVDTSFSKVISISRRDSGVKHDKLNEYTGSLEDPAFLEKYIKGDVLFCCLGTTIKKAGSKEAFKKVDQEIPILFGEIAKKNEIPVFCIVSSVGANANSSNFYLRTKGEMEEGICNLDFEKPVIARPSMLIGNRGEFRFGEEIGKIVMIPAKYLLFGRFKKYRAIDAETVSRALINISRIDTTERFFESDQLEKYGSIKKT